jgi:multiple sugar transport system substrate-binding protein
MTFERIACTIRTRSFNKRLLRAPFLWLSLQKEEHMKKFLLIGLLVLVSGIVFAEGVSEEEKPEKLVYLTPSWGAPSESVIAKFQEQTGIQLEVATVDIDTSRNRVLTAAAGSTNPADVIFVSADTFAAFRGAGAIRSLDDLAPRGMLDYLSGVDQFVLDGDLWAVPLYQQMVMIDYDKSALESIGMEPSAIKTWDDFEKAMVMMKEKGLYEYPYAAGIRPWTWYLTALSSGSELFDKENNPVFDNPQDPAYDAFARIIKWFQMGLISPERLSSSNPHPSFWAGQAAFHQAWQGSLGIANDQERSKVAPNADYLLLPEDHFTWLLPAGLTVSAFTDYPQAAMQLVEFFVQEDMQRFLFEANGLFPANADVFAELGQEGGIDGFAAMNEQSKFIVSIPYDQPWYIEFEKEAEQTMLRAARGEQSVEDALKALGEFARELKAEYE